MRKGRVGRWERGRAGGEGGGDPRGDGMVVEGRDHRKAVTKREYARGDGKGSIEFDWTMHAGEARA